MQHRRAYRLVVVVLASLALLLGGSEWAFAQGAPSADETFFLNNPHPAFPWAYPWALSAASSRGLVLRDLEVPPRSMSLPVEVVQPGSLPPTIEWQQVTLPGYRVTEHVNGFTVHGHWTVSLRGNAYYPTWVPTHFRSK